MAFDNTEAPSSKDLDPTDMYYQQLLSEVGQVNSLAQVFLGMNLLEYLFMEDRYSKGRSA
jgi:hypothetical protein